MPRFTFRRRPRREIPDPSVLNSAEIAAYYDEWHDRYVEGFGDVFQTLRTPEPSDLLLQLGQEAGLEAGQRVCDAGCGVGGPALVLAEHFGVEIDGVTVSGAQVRDAAERIEARGLGHQIRIHQGDFHRLEDLFDPCTFDVVYFLEAFCHTNHPETVLGSVRTVLKPGGTLFIKDLFRSPGGSPEEREHIAVAVRNTEHHCHLRVRPLDDVCHAIRTAGFLIDRQEILELDPTYDYDTGNNFVMRNGIDIFEGTPSTYLTHARIRAHKPA